MPQQFRIVCRGSKLSLAQADIFRKKLLEIVPEASAEIVIKETRGDLNQEVALQDIEGKDFFTQDIQDYLLSGQADFAVHSLKDVSGENFFQGTHFAIIEREVPHDVAIFHEQVVSKLQSGLPLKIGTSSPRRVEMGVRFLTKVLPKFNGTETTLEHVSIRGNVDTRLQKLSDGNYDGIILACAGLNRLLRAESGIASLLKGKRFMVLPLLECPPAPGQGAIVAETAPSNNAAVNILRSMNDQTLALAVDMERKIAHRYGSGCHQKFGAVHLSINEQSLFFAAGKDRNEQPFSDTYSDDGLIVPLPAKLSEVDPNSPILARHNIWLAPAGISGPLEKLIPENKKVWVAETALWYALANRGVWVEGSLEGLSIEFNQRTFQSPLTNRTTIEFQRSV